MSTAAYRGSPDAVATLGVRTTIMTTARLPEAVANELTKAVFENINDFGRLHPDFATLLPRDMVRAAIGVPVHIPEPRAITVHVDGCPDARVCAVSNRADAGVRVC